MIAVVLTIGLATPLPEPSPPPRAILPPRLVIRDPRDPITGRRARRRDLSLRT